MSPSTFTPSFSFFVECESRERFDALWSTLPEGGGVMMPPDNYGFSQHFGWLSHRLGVSWQLNVAGPQGSTAIASISTL